VTLTICLVYVVCGLRLAGSYDAAGEAEVLPRTNRPRLRGLPDGAGSSTKLELAREIAARSRPSLHGD
jgi:hypothetical protein